MKRKRLVWGIAISVALLAAVVFSAGFYYTVNKVRLINASGKTLTQVRVTLAERELWSGTLETGDIRTMYGFPQTMGSFGITFEASGRRVQEKFGYVEPFLGQRVDIAIMPSLTVHHGALDDH